MTTPHLPFRRALLVGVSYAIPFVAAGGILQALGLLLAGGSVTGEPFSPLQRTGTLVFSVGALAFGLLAPVLAAAVAYALAGRPGLVPGLTTGVAAAAVGAGFLGALVGGVLAGVLAALISRIRRPEWTHGPVLIVALPVVATLVTGGLMLGVIGPPLAAVTRALTGWLGSLDGSSTVLVGAVLGTMTAIDLGGPVNKVAYAFAASGLTTLATPLVPDVTARTDTTATPPHSGAAMAAVMAAGMCAPLALALATRLAPNLFTDHERAHAPTAAALGALFVTEGAIPYAVADPARVVPAAVLGSATAGAVAAGAHATVGAPHGGVLALFSVGHVVVFLTAIVLGTALSCAAVIGAKSVTRAKRTAGTTGGRTELIDSESAS
ncbi:fructose-specific PTS transporter subunit EIIC [Cryptosporangium arvum]|uniref:PTS system protein, fructose subfamily, IIC component n=1 Tax=Cryptosporangium arvum DSM 44712 TaxID=927661 RepID=A0A010ZX28_9ACTN|nr:fructose-specific PTS transporter subunit EIIC [Cryptosporangium arvum]EXG81762.1 PTS system protein, fructose subfamily, IIC component [Cryptosporangium arvum DSM 44712]